MCGVAGIYAYHYPAPSVDREELRTIRDHMLTRGPDGLGEWFSKDGRIALGHRRLSIIDLSDKGSQPMLSADGKLVISFNGEIYNYRALRSDLINKGHQFNSESDTEVLLYLYAEKGVAMLNDLRGMFAFALWDADKQAMLLARDPYGIKPLYYADDGWTLRTASQVKALLTSSSISRTPEPAGIAGFYLFGSVPEPYTTYQEVRSVPAGHYMWVDKLGPTAPVEYFSIAKIFADATQVKIDEDNIQENVREALLDSVQHHMVADVPVGAFLSSGVDSAALVGLMSELQGSEHPIQTITIAFEEFKGKHEDESPLAEKVAQQYGTKHTTRVVTEEEFKQDLPQILNAMDQPSIDGINTWFVSKTAKEQGLKVAISGLGGDELFGGYPSFRDIPRWVQMFSIPSRIPFLGDLFRCSLNTLTPVSSSIHPKTAGILKYGGYWPGAYLLRRGLFMPWELPKIMEKQVAIEGLARLNWKHHIEDNINTGPLTSFARVAVMEASLYMRNQLLRDADWAGMAHSLEIRIPLVDATLLQKLAPLILSTRLDGKTALGNSPNPVLPDNIVRREKTGFTTPIDKWQQQLLTRKNSPWSRRWAFTIMGNQGVTHS